MVNSTFDVNKDYSVAVKALEDLYSFLKKYEYVEVCELTREDLEEIYGRIEQCQKSNPNIVDKIANSVSPIANLRRLKEQIKFYKEVERARQIFLESKEYADYRDWQEKFAEISSNFYDLACRHRIDPDIAIKFTR